MTSNGYEVFYANLHSHCALSDGIGTPAEAYAYARDVAGIDVLALTDHTHLLSANEWNQLLATAAEQTQDGVFVALGAQEFGNLNDFGHMNIFDSAYRNPNPTDNLAASYNFIISVGAFASFNHPNPSYGTNFNDLAYYPEFADAMRALEVRNGLAVNGYQDQYIQALNNGWRVGPFANQDNHEGHWGDQGNPSMGGAVYLTGILSETLTKPAILDALRARRFYAMEIDPPSDRIELDFRVDGHPMGSEVTTGGSPLFTVTAIAVNGVSLFNRVELYRDGVVHNSQFIVGNQIEYEFYDNLENGEQHYYFVRVSQVDGDHAWSAPVWITAEVGPAAVADGPGSPRLLPCAPNPLRAWTDIRFELATPHGSDRAGSVGHSRVHLTVHDAAGRRVRDLGTRSLPPGLHQWRWDGRTDEDVRAEAGVYFYRLEASGRPPISGRIILVR